jgi:hypothetical protein
MQSSLPTAIPATLLFRLSWPLLISCGLFVLLLSRPELLSDGDIYWHLTIGQWILDHGTLPLVDHYSHSRAGGSWTPHEWLSEVLFAYAFNTGGWALVTGLAAGACACTVAIVLRYLLRFLEPIYALSMAVLAVSLLAPHLLARPHVLILPLLAAWGVGLLQAHDKNQAPRWWLALLMVPWANLHGSFVFGLALIGPFAIAAVLTQRKQWRRVMRDWAAFFALACGASLVTPLGFDGMRFAFEVEGMTYSLSQLAEWRSPDFQKPQPLELALLAIAAGVLSRGLKLSWLRIGLLLLLLHLALKHGRHADLLAVLGPLLLARPMGEQWRGTGQSGPQSLPDRMFHALAKPASAAAIAVCGVLVSMTMLSAVQADKPRPSASITPADAVQAALRAGAAGNVLNSYEFGGYLIAAGIPTFIDGRTDLFGDAFMWRYNTALQLGAPGALERLIERHDVRWTLLPPGTPAVALLDHLPGWRKVFADGTAVVHMRR